MDNFFQYHQAVNFLEGVANPFENHSFVSAKHRADFFIKRTKLLLNLLGNPERSFKCVHITGTSGKGTISSLIQAALTASGKKTGLFTSPFATTTIEEIQVNNKYITPAEFVSLVEDIKPALNKMAVTSPYGPASYFETLFALAALYFKKQRCEWAVLEAGCGGRFDATNTIPAPAVAVLTNVEYDHTEILGKTLKKIACEKAGIIKPGCKFWTAEQRPHLRKLLKDACSKEKAEFNWIKDGDSDYSALNKKLAKAVCLSLGLKEEVITKGFEQAFLPCRFEIMQSNPLVILDGAHNEAKISSTMHNLQKLEYDKLHVVFAVAANKNTSGILKLLAAKTDFLYLTKFEVTHRKCADPASLYKQTKSIAKNKVLLETFCDPWQALDQAFKSAKKNDAVLVTGSFFLSGELRKKWVPEEWILQNRKSR